RQALADVDGGIGIGVRAAGVVDGQRGIRFAAEQGGRVVLPDFPEWHADVGPGAGFVDFPGLRQRFDGGQVDGGSGGQELRIGVQGIAPGSKRISEVEPSRGGKKARSGGWFRYGLKPRWKQRTLPASALSVLVRRASL